MLAVVVGAILLAELTSKPDRAQIAPTQEEKPLRPMTAKELGTTAEELRATERLGDASSTPGSAAAVAAQPVAPSKWLYDESPDSMDRGSIRIGMVRSTNEVSFGFPYTGSQRAVLELRVHPQFGHDVILSIDKGQFLCGIEECSVAVRFDDGKPSEYTAVPPSDHGTTSLFIRNYSRFVNSARRAKTVSIETQFYQEGMRAFHFDIHGLKWQ